MKKKISLLILLLGILCLNFSCSEEEPFDFKVQEEAINFWTEPTNSVPNPSYPSSLRTNTFDFGSFSGFLARGYKGFNDIFDAELKVQTQGFTHTGDRKVAFLADSIQSGDGVQVTLNNDYVVKSGETTTKFPFKLKATTPGTTTTIVFTFDYDKTEFLPGITERQFYTLICNYSSELPQTVEGFGIAEWYWNASYGYAPYYGELSYIKLKFISLIQQTANLISLPNYLPTVTTVVEKLNAALVEYKALNAEDPVTYPPLYNDGTETWISFP